MIREELKEALDEFGLALRRGFGDRIVRLLLFGSVARGITHADSDVDVLVLVSPRWPKDGRRAVEAAVEVMLRRPEVVLSPLVMTPEELDQLRRHERRLALEIDRDGIAL